MDSVLLVGLGNPGDRFEKTRHNIGIRALREWARAQESAGIRTSSWKHNQGMQAQTAEVIADNGTRVYLLFPLTFMNKAGEAVHAFLRNHPVDMENILIIHDDLELPFGAVKEKDGGSASGHNGVRSVHEVLGTQDIKRLRIGIGRPGEEAAIDKYVLSPFTEKEENQLPDVFRQAEVHIDIFTERLSRE